MPLLFSDGFESGNFGAWTAQGTTAYMAVGASFKHDGAYGVIAQGNGYCYKDHAAKNRVVLDLWGKPHYCDNTNAQTSTLARILTSAGAMCADVVYRYQSGSGVNGVYEIGLRTTDDASSITTTWTGVTIAGGTYYHIQLKYYRSSGAGRNDGKVVLLVGAATPVVVATVTGIDNDTRTPARTELRLSTVSGTNSFWFYWDTVATKTLDYAPML